MTISAVPPSPQLQQVAQSSSPHRPARGHAPSVSDVDAQSSGAAATAPSSASRTGRKVDITA